MKSNITLMRSLLYVPGHAEHMILKARDSAADALILDLEDAVPVDQKSAARATVVQFLRELDFGGKEVFVRINALTTSYGLEDARAAASASAPGILLPKAEGAGVVTDLAPVLQNSSKKSFSKLLCLIETPRGVLAAREIAEASELIAGLVFGSADLARELGGTLSAGEPELLYARSHVLLAARVANVAAYDSPYFEVNDLDGVRTASTAARRMGYDGKTLIHPSHIEIANEIFAPTPVQLAEAERIVTALETAQASGRGAALLDGKMIDQVHLAAAQKLLAHAR